MTVESRRLVLHVEDDEDHAYLVRRCFRQLGDTCELLHFQTGESALEHVESVRTSGGRRPDLVLLDLHLRQMSGLEVLRTLKALPWFAKVPVVILSTSRADVDVSGAASLHANSYLTKPAELSELRALVERVDQYWLRTDLLAQDPPSSAAG